MQLPTHVECLYIGAAKKPFWLAMFLADLNGADGANLVGRGASQEEAIRDLVDCARKRDGVRRWMTPPF